MTCTNIGLTGGKFCSTGNPMGVPTGIWLAKGGFLKSASDFIDDDEIIEAVKGELLFPIHGDMFKGLENASDEVGYHTFKNKTQDLMDQGIVRLNVFLDLNECQKRQIVKFRNFRGQIFIEYDNWLRGSTPDSGTTVRGARVRKIHVEKTPSNSSDGAKGETKMVIELSTYKDFDVNDYAREMPFDLMEIDGLTEVDLTKVGTPTATSIVIDVASECYGEKFPISGLTTPDFAITGTGTITSATESATIEGRYTFVTVGLANTDSITLVASGSIAAASLFIKAAAPLVVSGIA